MKVLCQGSIGWLRVISFISLTSLVNAPKLEHLSVPSVCLGQKLVLRWYYDFSSATVGTITWTFQQLKPGREEIILATFDLPNGTFEIHPDAVLQYNGRISHMGVSGPNAGIVIANMNEKDVGSYGIRISINETKRDLKMDVASVSLADVKSNLIVASGRKFICSNESKPTLLSWTVSNSRIPAGQLCHVPTWTEWSKNGKAIATRDQIDGVINFADHNSRLQVIGDWPLAISIDPTLVTDAGSYRINAKYGNLVNIASEEITLQVSLPMNISKVADIRQCVGTDVVFPWKFTPGTDCKNHIRMVDHIVWRKVSSKSSLATLKHALFKPDDSRVKQYKESNAGIIIHRANESDAGIYEVSITSTKGENIKSTTELTLLHFPKLEHLHVPSVCLGQNLTLRWDYDFTLATTGNITWTFHQLKSGSKEIILATVDFTNWNFQIHPDAALSYKGRLSHTRERGFDAGIEIANMSEGDVGSYGIRIRFNETKCDLKRDDVKVSLTDVKSNLIVASEGKIICSTESKNASLSWKVSNKHLHAKEMCLKPTWTEWSKNGKAFARRDQVDGAVIFVEGVDLTGRLTEVDGFPLDIIIESTRVTDAGSYRIKAKYGSHANIMSEEITLQVSRPMNISKVKDIRQCVGTDVTFPWDFNPGTDCKNHARSVHYIVWEKDNSRVATLKVKDFTQINPRVDRYAKGNAGIIINSVIESDAGIYEVSITSTNGENIAAATKLTLDVPLFPKLEHLHVPSVCVGQRLTLPWHYEFTSVIDGNITWTFHQLKSGSKEIILATFDIANWKFQIHPDAVLKYKDRLSDMKEKGSAAGIEIANMSEKDVGSYGILISIKDTNCDLKTDVVKVSLTDVKSNIIVASEANTICSIESEKTTLSWKVSNPHLHAKEMCLKPTWTEWSKNGKAFARRDQVDGAVIFVEGVHLTGHLKEVVNFPLSIALHPTLVTDAGSYRINAKYGNLVSITSEEITLQVSRPMHISKVAYIRQCVGTDVVFPWKFTPGTDCENHARSVDYIVWEKEPMNSIVAKLEMEKDLFFTTSNFPVERYKESNAGIIIHRVNESDAGVYVVSITTTKEETIEASTTLTLELLHFPKIVSDLGPLVVKCEGEPFVFTWTFEYPEDYNICENPPVISRTWYLNGTLILSDNSDHHHTRTTTLKELTPKKTTKEQKIPQLTTNPKSTIPKDTTTETRTPEKTSLKYTSTPKTTRKIRREITHPQDSKSATFSFDRRFDAGLAVHRVTSEISGSYYVNVSFETFTGKVLPVFSDYTALVLKKAHAVSLQDKETRSLCTDEILHLKWKLVLSQDCSTPFFISWHFIRANQTEQKRIGFSQGGSNNFTLEFATRINVTERVSLTFHDLSTNDSGTYTVKLSYPSDDGSNSKNPKGVAFSESSINVMVYEADSKDCQGVKFENLQVQLTRHGEDVRTSTNRTVFVNDTITLFVDIPKTDELSFTAFFWKETHHKFLKQFFGKKCYEPGICSIQWKVSKRLPGIIFRPKEFRREVEFGMSINYMAKKSKTIMTSFYFRNHKDVSDSSKSSKSKDDKDGKWGKSGAVKQCALNRQAVLATTMFWLLLLHQPHP